MDPYVKWRAKGETKEQKIERLENKIKYESKKRKSISGPHNSWSLQYPAEDNRPSDDAKGNGTFNFVKENYKRIRLEVRADLSEQNIDYNTRMQKEHEITVQRLSRLSGHLGFKLLEWKFNKSLDWWQYEYKW